MSVLVQATLSISGVSPPFLSGGIWVKEEFHQVLVPSLFSVLDNKHISWLSVLPKSMSLSQKTTVSFPSPAARFNSDSAWS